MGPKGLMSGDVDRDFSDEWDFFDGFFLQFQTGAKEAPAKTKRFFLK